MADTADKKQINVLLTHDAVEVLKALHDAEREELKREGQTLSLSSYVEKLVWSEAKRKGIKPKKGRT